MFRSAQKPTIINEGLDAPSPLPEAPPSMPEVIAPSAPVASISVPEQPHVEELISHEVPSPVQPPVPPSTVKHPNTKPFYHKVTFIIPAVLVLMTMALAAYVVGQVVQNRGQVAVTPSPVPSLTPVTPAPTPIIDPKAHWKSYSNQETRLSFRFPETLYLLEEKKGNTTSVTLAEGPPPSDAIVFSVYVAPKIQLQSLLELYTSTKEELENGVESEFQIAGIPGVKVDGKMQGQDVILTYGYLELDTNIYLFVTQSASVEANKFEDIVDTVRFLDKGITEDWKTYENTTINYSFRYPPEWTVSTGGGGATESASRVTVRKSTGETEYQNLTIDTAIQTGKQKIELTASQVVSSLQNLSGWKAKPSLDFRTIGGASAQLVSGELSGAWQMYTVLWYKNILVQMSWKDGLVRAEQATVDNILSTFKFSK